MRVDYSKYSDKIKFWKSAVENVKDFTGTSPPSVFIGSAFYPKVFVGVLSPPKQEESTEILDSPEMWYKQRASISDIVGYRSQMVLSRFKTKSVAADPGKMEEVVQEVASAKKSADIEINLKNEPKFKFDFDQRASPVGSPAQVDKIRIVSNPSVEHRVDYIVSDNDMKAENAVVDLYNRGIEVSRVQKIFSSGMLGLNTQRKFVPTRWGITAVDDIIGKSLRKDVYHHPKIDEVTLYHNEYLGNHYEILLIPEAYQFELIESWANQAWGTGGYNTDYEPNGGRKDYASNTAGAFYVGRLAVLEHLNKIKRQASVLIVRDILPSYDVPLGIWQMRETVRGAFDSKPEKFSTVTQALLRLSSRMVRGSRWMGSSKLLKTMRQQKTIASFVS